MLSVVDNWLRLACLLMLSLATYFQYLVSVCCCPYLEGCCDVCVSLILDTCFKGSWGIVVTLQGRQELLTPTLVNAITGCRSLKLIPQVYLRTDSDWSSLHLLVFPVLHMKVLLL